MKNTLRTTLILCLTSLLFLTAVLSASAASLLSPATGDKIVWIVVGAVVIVVAVLAILLGKKKNHFDE